MKNPIVQEVLRLCNSVAEGRTKFYTHFRAKGLSDVVDVMLDCPEKPKGYNITITEDTDSINSICLTSGGADSTIAWYKAGKPRGLYIDIGQPYAEKEHNVLYDLGIGHFTVDLSADWINVNTWKHIIPGRNFLFLTIAAEHIANNGEIHFATVSGEGAFSGAGDKSQEFLACFENWYYNVSGKIINIRTLLEKTKAGWLKWFMDQGYDVNIIRHKTITCFSPTEKPCGSCQACLRKYLSFLYNNIDIAEDYEVHPMQGAAEYVNKYKVVLREALDNKDFSHYSRQRCEEDLAAIETGERIIKC